MTQGFRRAWNKKERGLVSKIGHQISHNDDDMAAAANPKGRQLGTSTGRRVPYRGYSRRPGTRIMQKGVSTYGMKSLPCLTFKGEFSMPC